MVTTRKSKSSQQRLRLIERRKHPRFLLSGEQFKEFKSRRIFSVYDLSMTGFSIKSEDKWWEDGAIITGVLNLHPDSIEVSGRLLGYYGDRAALKFEIMSTYARTSLARSLSASRLGKSLMPVKEKLTIADFWYHGACNTDLLLRFRATDGPAVAGKPPEPQQLERIDIFYSNFYCGWNAEQEKVMTGICQSMGKDARGAALLTSEPVTVEALELAHDSKPDPQKLEFARAILEAAPTLDVAMKRALLEKFAK